MRCRTIRTRQQILEQVERRRVEPLQIVEEQRERMLRPGEDADKRRNTSWKRRCASCGGSSGPAAVLR
jgi:hypothetical protein